MVSEKLGLQVTVTERIKVNSFLENIKKMEAFFKMCKFFSEIEMLTINVLWCLPYQQNDFCTN